MTEKIANSARLTYATFPPGLKAVMKLSTACAGVDCERRAICARTSLDSILGGYDAARLCYSGFGFFLQISPSQAVLEPSTEAESCRSTSAV